MGNYNTDKLNSLLKWTERVMQLEKLTGKNINEMLGHYADQYMDCAKCPLYEPCSKAGLDCDERWKNYLEGKY